MVYPKIEVSDMIQCEKGHFYDENRYKSCPYCSQTSNRPRSVTPPVAPNMEIPKPSCGKTVAIDGVDTAPSVGKTVAIDNYEEYTPHVNKTVAISQDAVAGGASGLPGMPSMQAAPVVPVAAAPVQEAAPAPMPAPAPAPFQEIPQAPVAAPIPEPIPSPIPEVNAPVTGADQDMAAEIPYNGISEEPERVLTEQFDVDVSSRPYAVSGLAVSENPKPLAPDTSYLPNDRPYAVSGLGVKENPKPIGTEDVVTIPVPNSGAAADGAAPSMQAEAAAFAAFGMPGGPIPGMVPGMPMPGPAPVAPAPVEPVVTPIVETPAPVEPVVTPVVETSVPAPVEPQPVVAETIPVPQPVEAPFVPQPSDPAPLHEQVCRTEETQPAEPEQQDILTPPRNMGVFVPAPAPVVVPEKPVEPVEPPKPVDPNATVQMTESDMDYLPRVHARAFLVCIDGPMTGASFVFQENKAVIGRQKNYEIALFRDNSVSRSQHAIIRYDKDSIQYTVTPGDAEKMVSVNGLAVNQEYVLKMYDVIGVGQSRLLFIPVCSDKFAW